VPPLLATTSAIKKPHNLWFSFKHMACCCFFHLVVLGGGVLLTYVYYIHLLYYSRYVRIFRLWFSWWKTLLRCYTNTFCHSTQGASIIFDQNFSTQTCMLMGKWGLIFFQALFCFCSSGENVHEKHRTKQFLQMAAMSSFFTLFSECMIKIVMCQQQY
jgi:hypothetical protein